MSTLLMRNTPPVVGNMYQGVVKKISRYGAFVDIGGGFKGLLHNKDISHLMKNRNAEQVLQCDQKVSVVVTKYESEEDANKRVLHRRSRRISLSMKKLVEARWDSNVVKKYQVGMVKTGTVVSITAYGVFVELENGIEGLVHKSNLDVKPNVFVIGQSIEVKILGVDEEKQRIELGSKQRDFVNYEKYKEGDVIKGRVKSIVDFGIFVELEPGVDGLVYKLNMGDLTPNDFTLLGEVDVRVLDSDDETKRISLEMVCINEY